LPAFSQPRAQAALEVRRKKKTSNGGRKRRGGEKKDNHELDVLRLVARAFDVVVSVFLGLSCPHAKLEIELQGGRGGKKDRAEREEGGRRKRAPTRSGESSASCFSL